MTNAAPRRVFSSATLAEAGELVSALAREVITTGKLAPFARRVGLRRRKLQRCIDPQCADRLPLVAVLRGGSDGLEILRRAIAAEWGLDVGAPAPLHHPQSVGARVAALVEQVTHVLCEHSRRGADRVFDADDCRALRPVLLGAIACLQAELRMIDAALAHELKPLASTRAGAPLLAAGSDER